jgi:hypothetical protein
LRKKFGVGSKEKENRVKEKKNRKKKLHYPVAAVLGCCMRWADAQIG